MGSSRFVPLVIAGFVGLLIGWLLGPDVDDVQDALGQRITALEAKIDASQAPLAALQTSVTGLDERTTAIATQVQALGNPAEAVTQLGTRVDAVAGAVAEQGKAVTDGLSQQVATLSTDVQGKLDALSASVVAAATAQPPAAPTAAAAGAPAAQSADALAAEIGSTGAVLLTGQTAIFGENRVFLSRIIDAEGKAVIVPTGGERTEIATGASADLGNGCSVSLAGIAGRAAYLATTGCGGAAPAPAPAPAAPQADAAAAPVAVPAAAAPSDPAAGAAAGVPISVGQTVIFGDKRAFLSRISTADNTAVLFVPGQGQVPVAVGAAADLGDGCTVTLASIEGGRAALQPAGCEGADPAAAAAPSAPAAETPPPAAPAPSEAAPVEAPAPAAEAPADPADPAAPAAAAPAAGGASPLSVGQTATFGDKRLFLSRLTPDMAYVVVVGRGPTSVAPGAAADLGGGCSATLQSIAGNAASFAPSGC